MLIYKVIGGLMIASVLICSFAGWLKEWLHEREKRQRRKQIKQRYEEYKQGFRNGTMRDIEEWNKENAEEPKRQNIICKNPELAKLLAKGI